MVTAGEMETRYWVKTTWLFVNEKSSEMFQFQKIPNSKNGNSVKSISTRFSPISPPFDPGTPSIPSKTNSLPGLELCAVSQCGFDMRN